MAVFAVFVLCLSLPFTTKESPSIIESAALKLLRMENAALSTVSDRTQEKQTGDPNSLNGFPTGDPIGGGGAVNTNGSPTTTTSNNDKQTAVIGKVVSVIGLMLAKGMATEQLSEDPSQHAVATASKAEKVGLLLGSPKMVDVYTNMMVSMVMSLAVDIVSSFGLDIGPK
eukprot:c2714_g2_i1.p1 GENE.c2714_g2_i1~~c2714_g2_i1.p1  ORF type:complete len:170 (-),score=64.87 c2714_g2_i1:43-552(-)